MKRQSLKIERMRGTPHRRIKDVVTNPLLHWHYSIEKFF